MGSIACRPRLPVGWSGFDRVQDVAEVDEIDVQLRGRQIFRVVLDVRGVQISSGTFSSLRRSMMCRR